MKHATSFVKHVQLIQFGNRLQNCPPYKCVPEPTKPPPVTLPPFIDREDRCSMTGRMFRTFDGTDYSYDICHHVLMRDMLQDMWSVSGKF